MQVMKGWGGMQMDGTTELELNTVLKNAAEYSQYQGWSWAGTTKSANLTGEMTGWAEMTPQQYHRAD